MDAQPSRSELERALDLAYRAVGRRERTVAELRTCLER
jgi:SOS response regulatory protein OraA/RecX